jgi:malate dehydrogenase
MSRPKVAVVGAGQVGATVAHLLVLKDLTDVVLVDVVDGLAAGKALDMLQAAAIEDRAVRVQGTTDFAAMAGSRVVVITAGLARKPGMSRDDLLAANAGIVGPIADRVKQFAPEAILIIVTNPLDVMTTLALTQSGFPRHRVLGMAGVLDSGRLRAFVAEKAGVPPANVQATVLGSHGDLMVPLLSSITIDGLPATDRLGAEVVAQLCDRARNAGAEIVALLKQSSAYYGPGSSVVQMVQAILNDTHAVLPSAVWLEGEYGLRDVCIGVPVELGRQGMVRVADVALTAEERSALHAAANQVREMIGQLRQLQSKLAVQAPR